MNESVRDRLDPLPPSAKLVYYVLDAEGRYDQTGLAEATRLSTRTVRFAVDKLADAGLVEEGFCPTDARRSVYEPATGVDADAETSPAAAVAEK
jgi:DNA-binding MarR family transcriptional regulator